MRLTFSLARACALIAGLALSHAALAQANPSGPEVAAVQTTEPSGLTAAATSSCAGGTYVGAPVVNAAMLLSDARGNTAGAFIISDEQIVAADLPAAINDAVGTVTWTVARGTLMLAGQAPTTSGLVISNVHLTDSKGVITDFIVASVIADATAALTIESVRSTSGVEVVPPAQATAARSLGSSCSCPACPLGGRFWAPFFVIGVGGSSAGQACCAAACDVGCAALHRGDGYPEAWLIGQGTWVTCMLCN